jgi:hypothetical protein
MRTRIAQLIEDAVAIIEVLDDPDNESWLNQTRAEIGLLRAKTALRVALAEVQDQVPLLPAPKVKPKKAKPAKAKPTLSREVITTPVPSLAS